MKNLEALPFILTGACVSTLSTTQPKSPEAPADKSDPFEEALEQVRKEEAPTALPEGQLEASKTPIPGLAERRIPPPSETPVTENPVQEMVDDTTQEIFACHLAIRQVDRVINREPQWRCQADNSPWGPRNENISILCGGNPRIDQSDPRFPAEKLERIRKDLQYAHEDCIYRLPSYRLRWETMMREKRAQIEPRTSRPLSGRIDETAAEIVRELAKCVLDQPKNDFLAQMPWVGGVSLGIVSPDLRVYDDRYAHFFEYDLALHEETHSGDIDPPTWVLTFIEKEIGYGGRRSIGRVTLSQTGYGDIGLDGSLDLYRRHRRGDPDRFSFPSVHPREDLGVGLHGKAPASLQQRFNRLAVKLLNRCEDR